MGIPNACCCGSTTCGIISSATAVAVSDWTQVSGTWTDSGGSPNWIQTTSANGLIIHNTPHPDGLSTGAVGFDFKFPTTGTIRLCLAYLDASNYLFVEVEHDASNPTVLHDVIVRLGYRTSGADTFLEEFNGYLSSTATLYFCYNGSRLSITMGSMSGHAPILGMDTPLTGTWGTKIAVQSIGIAGTLEFNAVAFLGNISAGCTVCCAACAGCGEGAGFANPATPGEVSLYLTGVANSTCANCTTLFNGSTWLLPNPYEPPAPVPVPGATAYEYATRSCRFELYDSTGDCHGAGAGSDMVRFTYGVSSAVAIINFDGRFDFTKGSYDCSVALSKTGGSNIAGFPQYCNWTGATADITPNMA